MATLPPQARPPETRPVSPPTQDDVIAAKSDKGDWRANEKPYGDNRNTRQVTLKAVCGPSDDGSPCITVMRPEED